MSGEDWSTRFPVYQVDFQAVASGKHIASTKRKVRWRFGFPNKQALDDGRTGVDCRGQEHDIVIIWSITSGKRQVYMDGTEVHFSTSRASTFQFSWGSRQHVLKVIAHATPPMSPTPGFRQYDFFVDGQSFFNMPKAYELGIRGPIPSHARNPGPSSRDFNYETTVPSPGMGIKAPTTVAEEETDLQRAIRASLQESRQFLATKEQHPEASSAPVTDLIGFDAPAQRVSTSREAPSFASYNSMPQPSYEASPPASYGTALPASHGHFASQPLPNSYSPQNPGYGSPQPRGSLQNPPAPAHPGTLVVSNTQSQQYSLPPSTPSYQPPAPAPATYPSPQATAYGSPPPPAVHSATPQPPAPGPAVLTGDLFAAPPVDPFAPQQPGANMYGFSQVDDPFAPKPPPPPSRDDITKSILGAYSTRPAQPGQSGQVPVANGQPAAKGGAEGQHDVPALSMNEYTAPAEKEKPLSEMEKAMKKLVNIERIDEPAEVEYTLSLKKEEVIRVTKDGKSRGLPPVATGVVGSNATLNHIKEVKPNTPKTGEGVMRAPPQLFHPNAVNAGALVVHGQGPPPIQRGFGIGYGAPPPNFQQQRW